MLLRTFHRQIKHLGAEDEPRGLDAVTLLTYLLKENLPVEVRPHPIR